MSIHNKRHWIRLARQNMNEEHDLPEKNNVNNALRKLALYGKMSLQRHPNHIFIDKISGALHLDQPKGYKSKSQIYLDFFVHDPDILVKSCKAVGPDGKIYNPVLLIEIDGLEHFLGKAVESTNRRNEHYEYAQTKNGFPAIKFIWITNDEAMGEQDVLVPKLIQRLTQEGVTV